jgi:hypothetical protein
MDDKIRIKGRIVKTGNRYALAIPKALVDSNVFKERELVVFEVVDLPQRSKMRELGFYPENLAFDGFIMESPLEVLV